MIVGKIEAPVISGVNQAGDIVGSRPPMDRLVTMPPYLPGIAELGDNHVRLFDADNPSRYLGVRRQKYETPGREYTCLVYELDYPNRLGIERSDKHQFGNGIRDFIYWSYDMLQEEGPIDFLCDITTPGSFGYDEFREGYNQSEGRKRYTSALFTLKSEFYNGKGFHLRQEGDVRVRTSTISRQPIIFTMFSSEHLPNGTFTDRLNFLNSMTSGLQNGPYSTRSRFHPLP